MYISSSFSQFDSSDDHRDLLYVNDGPPYTPPRDVRLILHISSRQNFVGPRDIHSDPDPTKVWNSSHATHQAIRHPHHHLHQYSAANATNVQQVQSANVNNFAPTPFPPSSPYANHGNVDPAHFEWAPQRPARSHDVQFTRRHTFNPLGRVPQMASSPVTSNMAQAALLMHKMSQASRELQEIVKLFGEAYPELLDLHAVEAFADELESIGNFASRVRKLAKDLADRAEHQSISSASHSGHPSSAASGYSINAQPSPISSSQFLDNAGSGIGNHPMDATHLTGTVSSPWSPHGDQRFGPAAYPSTSVNQWPTKYSPSPAFHSRNASGQGRSTYASLSLARNSDFIMVCPQERMMQRELCEPPQDHISGRFA